MDRDLEELNRRIKTLEELTAKVELHVLKTDILFETEQVLELRRNAKNFAEIDNAFHICESVNEHLMVKVKHQQELIEILNVKMEALKGSFVNVQKSLCELINKLKQQEESKTEMSALKELVDNVNLQKSQCELHETSSSNLTFEKKTEENLSQLKRESSLDKEARSKSHLEPKAEFKQVVQSAAQINVWNEKPDFVWKIPNVMDRICRGTSDSSQCFSVRGYSFTLQGFIRFKEGDFLLCIFFISDAPQHLRFPSVHLTLKNQIGDGRPDLVRSGSFCFGTKLTAMRFIFHESIIDNSPYIENDSITVEIHVEPPGVAKQVYSRDGTLMWTIHNFEKYRELETKGLSQFQLSPYFYTTARGYRVQAAAYLNGEGSFHGVGMSVRITFLMGEFDEELSPSFSHSTSITMGAESDPETCRRNVVDRYDIGREKSSYVIHLWSHCQVETTLVNDCLILEIAIKE